MPKITTFDRQGVRQFRAALEAALGKVAEETGLNVKQTAATYDPTTNRFTLKIEASSADSEKLTFERLALGYGFKAEDYRQKFTTRQGTFTLRGVTPSGCVLALDNTGSNVKFPTRATDAIVKLFHPEHRSWDEKFRDAAKGE